MQLLNEYKICVLNENDLDEYTHLLMKSFGIFNDFEDFNASVQKNFLCGNIFLGARLFNSSKIIGGICFEKKPLFKNEIYIENLFVDEYYRNYGVATNLINYVINNKISLFNIHDINLYLFCTDEIKDFYVKQDFIITDEWDNEIIKKKTLRMDKKI